MIKIKNATKLGYIEIIEGGVLDLSFPESKTRRGRVIEQGRISPTLDTGCDVGVIQVCQVYGTDKEPNPSGGRVFDPEGLMRTLGGGHGMSQPLIVNRFKDNRKERPTLAEKDIHGVLLDDGREVVIRKLTPKECFRLQGWTDDYFEKAQFVNSDSQLYKQAGNGVTVNVIYQIAKKLKETQNEERKRD